MAEHLVGGGNRTRAQRLYEEYRISGSAFWNELDPQTRATWVVAAAQQHRAETAEARIAELEKTLQWIANTNGAQGVLVVNVARRALKGTDLGNQ